MQLSGEEFPLDCEVLREFRRHGNPYLEVKFDEKTVICFREDDISWFRFLDHKPSLCVILPFPKKKKKRVRKRK